MADNSVVIAELEAILNAGVTGITIDGNRTEWDLGEIRKRLVVLKNEDDTATKRPTRLGINLRDDTTA